MMMSRKFLFFFACLFVMAFFVDGIDGRDLMKKKKGKGKGKGKGKENGKKPSPSKTPTPSAPSGISAATIQQNGWVKVGSSVYNIGGYWTRPSTVDPSCTSCTLARPLTRSPTDSPAHPPTHPLTRSPDRSLVRSPGNFRHPGGSIINQCLGKDCTALFNANHNSGAISKVAKYKGGSFCG